MYKFFNKFSQKFALLLEAKSFVIHWEGVDVFDMKINLKRKVSLFLTIIASLCLLLFFIYLGFKDENVTISTTDPTGKMQYALVNEDKGAVFEGKNYSLGSDFVTLINKDSKIAGKPPLETSLQLV